MDKVRVPVDLLLDPSITASAKVIWMALQLYSELTRNGRPSPTRLAALTGLSRPTARKGLARLAAAGWLDNSPGRGDGALARPYASPHVAPANSHGGSHTSSHARRHASPAQPRGQRFVAIPRELLEDRSVKPQAVVMYGVLMTTPEFHHPKGKYTCKQLKELTGRALKTIRRAIDILARRGWLTLARKSHLYPFTFVVRNPVYEESKAELDMVKKRISAAKFFGEALMKEFATLLCDSDEFEDNANPGYLVNPFTGERMELDRYYSGRLALEFNGPQHYEETEFATAQEVQKQRARDLIKAMICKDRGIPLIVIHPEDLTIEAMTKKICPHLPLRDLRNKRPIAQYLEEKAERYRMAIRRRRRITA